MTRLLRTDVGTMELRPIQALALSEIRENGGLLGAIGVGHGKTLVSLLAPSVLYSKRPLLLLPAQLKRLTLDSILPELRKHWRISPDLVVESYHAISNKPNLLFDLSPDLIIADECHKISRKNSARTRRILRYFDAKEETRFVGLSGTITRKSLEDYWHLLLMALRENAPTPLKFHEMRQWGLCIDDGVPDFERPQPGAFKHWLKRNALEGKSPSESRSIVRSAYRERLTETAGVVATSDAGVGASLVIRKHSAIYEPIGVAPWISESLKTLEDEWTTPGGEEVSDAVDYWRKAREISMGFYYVWNWGEDGPDLEWLEARKEWRRFVRRTASRNRDYDTELLISNACERGDLLSVEWTTWNAIKDRANPKTETVWKCDTVLEYGIELAEERKDTILWFEHKAVGERLKELRPEWPVFVGGVHGNTELTEHVNNLKGPCSASIKAHGVGVNIQALSDGIVLTPPSSGAIWEQLLGRTHRTGQRADVVNWTVFVHTRHLSEAFSKAVENGRYIEEVTGQKQRINYSTIYVGDGHAQD